LGGNKGVTKTLGEEGRKHFFFVNKKPLAGREAKKTSLL
jgi:hypothetical protein